MQPAPSLTGRRSKGNRPLPAPSLEFGLSYGQSLDMLERLGFADGISRTTLGYYLKSLRKLGVPFDRLSAQGEKRLLATFTYYHLMELSLLLTLRVYWTLPDAVLEHIRAQRDRLYTFYRRAFLEANHGYGAPIKVTLSTGEAFMISGVFLDPGISYAGGQLLLAKPPSLLKPSQALRSFGVGSSAKRSALPINLSELALRLVEAASQISAKR